MAGGIERPQTSHRIQIAAAIVATTTLWLLLLLLVVVVVVGVILCSNKNIQRKEHEILIISDNHTRCSAWNVKIHLSDKSEINGLVKPGSATNTLVRSAKNNIMKLTKNNVIIFCVGAPRNVYL